MSSKKTEKEHIIWQDEHLDIEDWKDDLLEEHPDATDDELYELMRETNALYLDDERANLRDVVAANGILVVATLGLWDGTHQGFRHIRSGKIEDCLQTAETGSCAWYVDNRGEFRARIHHHDGTNRYRYRGIKSTTTEAQLDALTDLIYDGKDFEEQLRKLTYRLGDMIGDVYGWNFPHRPTKL